MNIILEHKEKITLRSSSDIYDIMRLILEKENRIDCGTKEYFWVISLDVRKKILNIELVGMGSIKSVPATPTEVFSLPVHKKASSIILVHNHPSGCLMPSEGDKDVTSRLIQAGLILNIDVDDHVIITDRSYYSFYDSGLLEKLSFDNKYTLTFIREKQLKKEVDQRIRNFEKKQKESEKKGREKGIKEGEAKGAKATKKEIARQMLLDQEPLEKIKKWTGITAQWLGRLQAELAKEEQ